MAQRRGRIAQITRKSARELEIMREAGRIVAQALEVMRQASEPGVSTDEIDRLAEETIVSAGAIPSFKGYHGYPAAICADPDDIVVHGFPSDTMVLQEGQVFGVDVGAEYMGYHGDAARTFAIGEISAEKQRLMDAGLEGLRRGIAAAQAGNRLVAISSAVQTYVEAQGYSVVRDLVGHGIGRAMHEPPQVPNFVQEGHFAEYNLTLRPGHTLAIEPMVNAGTYAVVQDANRWTIRTADGQPSVHFENTIAVSKNGPVILTAL